MMKHIAILLAFLITVAPVTTLSTMAKADSHAISGSPNFQLKAFNQMFEFQLPDNLCQITEGDWYNTTMEFLKTAEVQNKTIGLALECKDTWGAGGERNAAYVKILHFTQRFSESMTQGQWNDSVKRIVKNPSKYSGSLKDVEKRFNTTIPRPLTLFYHDEHIMVVSTVKPLTDNDGTPTGLDEIVFAATKVFDGIVIGGSLHVPLRDSTKDKVGLIGKQWVLSMKEVKSLN